MSCDRCASGWIGDVYASGGAGVGCETPEPCPHCSEGAKAKQIELLREELQRERAEHDKDLNCRVSVETRLLATARGKKPPPDAFECKEMALKLGIPDEYRTEETERE